MDETLRAQVDAYLPHLDSLIRRGRVLRDALSADSSSTSTLVTTRVWQQDCGVTVNQLSGGSKAHWLARAFSAAFMMRSTDGHAVESAAQYEIVDRLVDVLEQAVASLRGIDTHQAASTLSHAEPTPRRFDFVHNPEIRPVIEQAYADSRSALEESRYGEALLISCGVLEAIVTDALEHKGLDALAAAVPPTGRIADWSFEARLAVAERAGLIRGGCARLPPIARRYRDLDGGAGDSEIVASERDARTAGQVLRVVMRDLDPGR